MRRYFTAVLVLAALVAGARADAQRLAFEVASIKRNISVTQSSSIRVQPGGRVAVTNSTLFSLIRNVYRLEAFEIVGGPDWIREDRWDIVAKAPGDSDQPTIIAMAKTLLADRFKLLAHTESRDMPLYALTAPGGRLGPRLQASSSDCPKTVAELGARDARASKAPNGAPECSMNVSPGRMLGATRSMADIARILSPLAGRTVVDRTGLAGVFDVDLTWNESDEGPSLFTAIREQLGLKLDAARGPVDVLVIDSAERPTDD